MGVCAAVERLDGDGGVRPDRSVDPAGRPDAGRLDRRDLLCHGPLDAADTAHRGESTAHARWLPIFDLHPDYVVLPLGEPGRVGGVREDLLWRRAMSIVDTIGGTVAPGYLVMVWSVSKVTARAAGR